jgi:hypothetical protein
LVTSAGIQAGIDLALKVVRRFYGGRWQATARLGNTEWQTTLFPDKERGYLLAIKADVRKKEKVGVGDRVRIEIRLA